MCSSDLAVVAFLGGSDAALMGAGLAFLGGLGAAASDLGLNFVGGESQTGDDERTNNEGDEGLLHLNYGVVWVVGADVWCGQWESNPPLMLGKHTFYR